MNHHNHVYSGGFPLAAGDRFYSQDLGRDFWFNLDAANRAVSKEFTDFPVLFDDAEVEQGSDYEHIDIALISGLVNFEVTIPNDLSTIPGTTQDVDIITRVDVPALTDEDISVTATLDGAATNYVKITYSESDGNTRNRAKKAGSYAYEKVPAYTLVVNTTAPTDYDLVLAEIVGDGSTFLTIINQESTPFKSQRLSIIDSDITLVPNKKYLAKNVISLTLPSADEGDSIDIYVDDYAKIIQSDANEIISYLNKYLTTQGVNGYLQLFYKTMISLIYRGTSGIRDGTYTKLSDPSTLPDGHGRGVAFSPDGIYMAVAHFTSQFISIYKRSGDVFTKIADPSTLPAASRYCCAFSPDGIYLAVGGSGAPTLVIYKRNGDVFTKLSDPSTLPAGTCEGCQFSNDGTYLITANTSTPFMTVYKRSGDTFTKLADPSGLPADDGTQCAISPDGNYIAITHLTTPFIALYSKSNDVLTKLSNPTTLAGNTCHSVAFSPDGMYVAVGVSVSPFLIIYKRDGNAFDKLADPSSLPPEAVLGVSYTQDGKWLVTSNFSSPYIEIYEVDGENYTKLSNPASLPAGVGNSIGVSLSGNYVAVSHDSSPNVTIYKTNVDASKVWEIKQIELVDDNFLDMMFE